MIKVTLSLCVCLITLQIFTRNSSIENLTHSEIIGVNNHDNLEKSGHSAPGSHKETTLGEFRLLLLGYFVALC